MISILLFLAIFLAVLVGVNFVRVILGPTLFDRLLGVGAIGTNAVLLLAVIGFLYGRPDGFLDLAITYAILNFVGVVAIAKFLDAKREVDPKALGQAAPLRPGQRPPPGTEPSPKEPA
jgi:multicomponent Na+:H+ antiporter subunit F